jgi:ABC-type nitrate/sulfonate/bicarbonate transport system substrate-binding protein
MGSPRRTALLLAVAVTLLAGCGGTSAPSETRPDQPATLLLDGPPTATDAGIYLARQRDYDEAEGVQLQVHAPATPREPLRALTGGQAQLAIVDLHDLALARERREDVVAVMALVQTPLAAVLTERRSLVGARIAVSGRPADVAIARAIAGGGAARTVRTSFRTAVAVRRGQANAAVGLWPIDGTALPHARQFRIDALKPPPYPELVLATSRETLQTQGPVVRAAVRALRRGYEATIDDPDSAVSALLDADPALRRPLTAAQLDAVSPSFTAGAPRFGVLDPTALRAWAAWEQRVGITRRAPDVDKMFDPATSRAGLTTDPNA